MFELALFILVLGLLGLICVRLSNLSITDIKKNI